MGLLYASELQDPSEWVLQNAQDILDSVKKAGGWAKVFPKGVPTWLHKLRNYFNVEPVSLRLVDNVPANHAMHDIRSYGQIDGLITQFALTGDVYFDEEAETWYQMGAGGTIYHWGGGVTWEPADAFNTQFLRGQARIPIFKLICPDGTGGSKETIISNPKVRKVRVVAPMGVMDEMQGTSTIGAKNEAVLVIDRVETRMKYQGSYNFSETSVVGLDAHKKNDVKPHMKDGQYIDPLDRFEPLNKRIFNEFVLKTAGAETKRARPSTYQDDIREDPLKKK